MACRFMQKKNFLINEADIETTKDKNGKIQKSYVNVLLAKYFGLKPTDTGADLLKAKEEANRARGSET